MAPEQQTRPVASSRTRSTGPAHRPFFLQPACALQSLGLLAFQLGLTAAPRVPGSIVDDRAVRLQPPGTHVVWWRGRGRNTERGVDLRTHGRRVNGFLNLVAVKRIDLVAERNGRTRWRLRQLHSFLRTGEMISTGFMSPGPGKTTRVKRPCHCGCTARSQAHKAGKQKTASAAHLRVRRCFNSTDRSR